MAEVKLTNEKSEKYFYNALCNEGGIMVLHGCQFQFEDSDYKNAKKKLKAPCIEDVLMQILKDGGKLTLEDIEGDGEYTRSVTLKNVHERVQKTPMNHLQDMIDETDDADTADAIIQTVFLEKIIFG